MLDNLYYEQTWGKAMNFTAKQVDLITNAVAGVTGFVTLGLSFGALDFKQALAIGFVAQTIGFFLTGKGVPSVKAVAQEIRDQGTKV
jgi:hypothetical protein